MCYICVVKHDKQKMEIVLKLYTYVDGVNDTPFPNDKEQAMFTFTYEANRMAGSPTITAKVKHRLCLDDLWTDNVYAMFNGVRYYIMNTPSSSKDNEDARYEHDLELMSEREILNHVYFIDAVQGDSSVDQPKSNTATVQFFGDVNEFAGRLNACFQYQNLNYTAVVDEGVESEDKQVSFEDKYILEALQEIYNVYEIPYYFVGNVVHIGYSENTVTYPLKYGFDEALLSISKDNANYALINKIKGQGSSDNIPYYYPNNSPKGDIGIRIISGSMVVSNFIIYDYEKFASSMSTTDTCTVRQVTGESGVISFVWSMNGKDIELSDIGIRLAYGAVPKAGSSFGQRIESYITPSDRLMPSIYRETKGAEQFYEAKNGTYEDGEGGYYEFENEYSEKNPRQGTTNFEDIKPTIKEMTNASGQRIDMFTAFAYDLNDNDEVDEEGKYIHPYFFAKLRKFDGDDGFNLFDHAIEGQTMTISFTSGACGACSFEIGVGKETEKNIVQVDDSGNLKRDENGNVLWEDQTPQDRQNDTSKYEVWIALKKDDSTYSYVMPNVTQNIKPSTSDTFVILGINLPTAYITAAEKRLEQSLIKYMWMNNTEKFTFSIKFSRIFFTEHPEVLEQLNENSRVLVEYNGKQHTLYVDSFTYRTDESSPLPEITVDLVDTLSIGQNSLQTQLDSVKQDILSSVGGGDFLKQGLKYFLRKDVADTASGKITFRKGLEVGQYTTGILGTGGAILVDTEGNSHAELDYLTVRKKATFTEIDVQELRHIGGSLIISPAAMVISEVEETTDGYKCYFETEDSDGKKIYNEFVAGDQGRCQTFNLEKQNGGQIGNRYWWRLVTEVGEDYVVFSKTDCDVNSDIPQAGDNVAQIGNRTDKTRQNAQVYSAYGSDSPSRKMYQGIDRYDLTNKDIKSEYYDITTGRFKEVTYGDAYFGDKEGNNYFKYDVDEGVDIKGKVQIAAGSTGWNNIEGISDEFDSVRSDAQKAQESADKAQSVADNAYDRLEEWASDGIISPTEKLALKQEIENLQAEYDTNIKNAEKYNIDYSQYKSNWESYKEELEYHSADTPENIPIMESFKTSQSNFYQSRTELLTKIAEESKKYADELVAGISVGAENLLLNTGFTGNYETEKLDSNSTLNNGTQLYSKNLENWSGSATVIETEESASGYAVTLGSLSQTVSLIANESYVISYKAKNGTVNIQCGNFTVSQTASSSMERYSHKFTFTSNGMFSISGTATVCEIKLERGTIATDWCPSRNDRNPVADEFKKYWYLMDALEGTTSIDGGLILTSIVRLGQWKDGKLQKVNACVSGIYNDDDDVAFSAGGDLDKAIYTVMLYKNNPNYVPTSEELKNIANCVITHGGRAILNDVIVRGYIYALGGLFRGRVETSVNGKRIVIDPSDSSMKMYDSDGKLCLDMSFVEEDSGRIFSGITFTEYEGDTPFFTSTLSGRRLSFDNLIENYGGIISPDRIFFSNQRSTIFDIQVSDLLSGGKFIDIFANQWNTNEGIATGHVYVDESGFMKVGGYGSSEGYTGEVLVEDAELAADRVTLVFKNGIMTQVKKG